MSVDLQSPMGQLLYCYILDVLGKLPSENAAILEGLDLPSKFKVAARDWRSAIRQVLQLSPTFNLAVLDIWYRNREELDIENDQYTPENYAANFIEEYYRKGSRIDQWKGDALEIARKRVARYGHAV